MPSKYHVWKAPVRKALPPPRVSIIAHQPDDRPVNLVPGGTAANWVTCPPKPLYTPRTRTGLSFTDKAASFSPGHDSDGGWGASRRKGRFATEPAGYTARTPSTTGKTLKGELARSLAAIQAGR